jgi:hypothetical protein
LQMYDSSGAEKLRDDRVRARPVEIAP